MCLHVAGWDGRRMLSRRDGDHVQLSQLNDARRGLCNALNLRLRDIMGHSKYNSHRGTPRQRLDVFTPKGGCVHAQGWVCPCPRVDVSMPKGGCVHAQGWVCPCPRVDVSMP
ncbi:hypothetical protein LSAT2_008706, partial [Lamellibrachia satsuma]